MDAGFDPVLAWSHPEYPSLLPEPDRLRLAARRPMRRRVAGRHRPDDPGRPAPAAGRVRPGRLSRSAWPWAFGVFYATIPLEWSQKIAWQYADRPLAVFLLAGAGCLALALRQGRRGWLFLAGLFWGAAAFTKDEGKAALALLASARRSGSPARPPTAGVGRRLGGLALLALGLAPGLASLALQRHLGPRPVEADRAHDPRPAGRPGPDRQILRFLLGRLVTRGGAGSGGAAG